MEFHPLAASVGGTARMFRMPLKALTASRPVQLCVIAAAGIGLLSGCLGDPPPDPEIQPLEIIVGNPDPKYGPCLLNVDEVGAGTHEVTPIAMAGKARVRILDPSGAVVFERTIDEHPAEGGGQEVPQSDQESVVLAAGEHRVECILADGTHATSLRVVPARPGR